MKLKLNSIFVFSKIKMTSQLKFQYNGINYSTSSLTTAKVGYGKTKNDPKPYNTAVSADYTGEINIPSFVYDSNNNKYKVTAISAHAFYQCDRIKVLIIPYTIEVIEWSAIAMAGLEQLIISPNSQLREIGVHAVHLCYHLSYIILPASVKILDAAAFRSFNGTLYYCGHNQFTNEFQSNLKDNAVHVPMNYPYSKFGNLDIIRDDFCLTGYKCPTIQNKIYNFHFFKTHFLYFYLSEQVFHA